MSRESQKSPEHESRRRPRRTLTVWVNEPPELVFERLEDDVQIFYDELTHLEILPQNRIALIVREVTEDLLQAVLRVQGVIAFLELPLQCQVLSSRRELAVHEVVRILTGTERGRRGRAAAIWTRNNHSEGQITGAVSMFPRLRRL